MKRKLIEFSWCRDCMDGRRTSAQLEGDLKFSVHVSTQVHKRKGYFNVGRAISVAAHKLRM